MIWLFFALSFNLLVRRTFSEFLQHFFGFFEVSFRFRCLTMYKRFYVRYRAIFLRSTFSIIVIRPVNGNVVRIKMGRACRFLVLLRSSTFNCVQRVIRFIFCLFQMSVLATQTRRRILTTSLSTCITFNVRRNGISNIRPTIFIRCLCNNLIILMMARRSVKAATSGLSQGIFKVK